MKYDVCLITPTRDRAEAFALCVRWMKRQTYRGTVQWIVVDDGDVPVDRSLLADGAAWPIMGWKIDYIRRPTSTVNCTLHHNLLAALEIVAADQVVIIEDDEHYAPVYVEEMVWRLRDTHVIGEAKARYYHVPMRRWDLLVENNRHASLCRTAFSRPAFAGFKAAVEETLRVDDPFVDLRFWAKYTPPPLPTIRPVPMGDRPWAAGASWGKVQKSGAPRTSVVHQEPPDGIIAKLFEGRGISVGIKGMPGRGNLGSLNSAKLYRNLDEHWDKLIEWIGPDAQPYMELAAVKGWRPVT